MSALDTLLYVADACSADRTFPGARKIHAAARRNLDRAFELALRIKIDSATARGSWLHPLSLALLRRRAGRP